MVDTRQVWDQIAGVLDPELDQSIVTLGFVEEVAAEETTVTVRLRLPTYFCAANFTYLMAADVRERALRVPGVAQVRVRVEGHYAGDKIGEGVSAGKPFTQIFAGEADAELDDLRATFARKAFLIRQEQLLRSLLRAGISGERLVRLTDDDVRMEGEALVLRVAPVVACTPDVWRTLPGMARSWRIWQLKRMVAAVPTTPSGPLFTDLDGRPLPAVGLLEHLREARMVRLNGAFNTLLCTGLARARYGREVAESQLSDLSGEPDGGAMPREASATAEKERVQR